MNNSAMAVDQQKIKPHEDHLGSMSSQGGNGYISRGNMAIIISAAGLVMLAFGGFITLQSSASDRRLTDLASNHDKLDREKLTIREFEEFRRNDETWRRSIEAELLRLRATAVTNETMAKFEMNNASRQEGQAARLLKLEDELHGSSNIGKAIDRMQEHINELDKRLLTVFKPPGGT